MNINDNMFLKYYLSSYYATPVSGTIMKSSIIVLFIRLVLLWTHFRSTTISDSFAVHIGIVTEIAIINKRVFITIIYF